MNAARSLGDLDGLYKNRKLVLWVEDELSAAYLAAAWDEPRIGFLVAGSGSGIAALVESARRAGLRGVHGLRDRDFGTTNYPWKPGEPSLRLAMHEIENALLDPVGLAQCAELVQRSEGDIRVKLGREAQGMLWGTALAATLHELNERSQSGYPGSSIAGVADRGAALALVTNSTWWQRHGGQAGCLTQQELEGELDSAQRRFAADIQKGEHLTSFAGKQLLDRIWSWLLKAPRAGLQPTRIDLAKALGEAQRLNDRLPAEIEDLRQHLLQAI